jgi:autotransporter-associated beta strand protein
MKRKKHYPSYLFIIFLFIIPTINLFAQRKMEFLDRGVVAVKVNTGVYISWRLLNDELHNTGFNIYRDGTKLNSETISESTNFLDTGGLISSTYTVTKVKDGAETTASNPVSVWEDQYLDIPVRTIDGGYSTYQINDGSVGDLDGDGEYEIVIKRLAVNMSTESTDYHYLEAYELDGTFLWAINLGPNLYNKVEVNFLVYDFDEDGKAEIATRTSEGTIDALGNEIGDIDGDGKTNYRYSISSFGYRSEGPDFISIFDGETGEEIARENYIPLAPISQWGLPGMNINKNSHRGTKCMWTVAYLDGKHPSIVNGRGIYERIKLEAWDFDGTSLSKRWHFDSSPDGVPTEYHGQGNHNLSLADVDQDGKDEIVYASMVIDDDGTGLYSTELGHGDALHVLDMDPERTGLEIWACLENSPMYGATYRDAETGEIMIHYINGRDMGRCAAGDITAEHKGAEMWGGGGNVFYNVKGEVIGNSPPSVNFMIWWDGDLLREFCDHSWLGETIGAGYGKISKYNGSSDLTNLLLATETYSNNYTKGTPVIQADILGDWREEVAWRTKDNQFIRLYTTTHQTSYKIPTLMQEPQYRLAVAWQNNSYNQPPHTSIYLAAEMQDNVPYPVSNNKVIWNTGSNWDINTSTNWKDADDNLITYNDGDDVLFDLTGDNSGSINITTTISPRSLTYTSPKDYEFSGTGNLSSDMALYKAGTGKLTINNSNDFSGVTKVLGGQLAVNGELSNSNVIVGMFGELFANGTFGDGVHVKADGKLQIGEANYIAGNPNITGDLQLDTGAKLYFDLSDDTSGISKSNDKINISGDLILQDDVEISLFLLDDSLAYGCYELIKFSGSISGNINKNLITGIEGTPFNILKTDTSLILQIIPPRENTIIEWDGKYRNEAWDKAITKNWKLESDSTLFLDGDTVLFNDSGLTNSEVDIVGTIFPSKVLVASSGTYSFTGPGDISGNCTLEKSGAGKLIVQNKNSYSGPTILKGGTVEVEELGNAGELTSLGSADNNNDNIIFDGGTLSITANESNTNRNMSFIGNGSLYTGSNKSLIVNSVLSGAGKLNKTGLGKLTLTNSNTIEGGITIESGEIYLENENSITNGLGSGSVTIQNGTLSMLDNESSASNAGWDIIVPPLYSATLKTDSRCILTGSLSGGGDLNLCLPGNNTELQGDWSGYMGSITVSSDSGGGRLLLANNEGYAQTEFHLDNNIVVIFRNSTSDTIEIGALSGDTESEFGAGGTDNSTITWKIGGKNTSFTFDGLISDKQYTGSGALSKIIKTGTGEMQVTNANTYSGGTVIEQGALAISNTSGSATGTGKVIVKSGGTLTGTGYTSSAVVVESNGVISPGISGIGSLSLMNTVDMNEGSYYLAEINTDNMTSDELVVFGTINLDGILYLSVSGTKGFSENDSVKILNAYVAKGDFKTILPLYPEKGLEWNTATLKTDGYLRVRKEGYTNLNKELNIEHFGRVYPNPANGNITIHTSDKIGACHVEVRNIMGQTVFLEKYSSVHNSIDVNLDHLVSGTYFILVYNEEEYSQSKLILE